MLNKYLRENEVPLEIWIDLDNLIELSIEDLFLSCSFLHDLS